MAGNLVQTISRGMNGGGLQPISSQYTQVVSTAITVDEQIASGTSVAPIAVAWLSGGTSAGDLVSLQMLASQPMTIQTNGTGTIGVQTVTGGSQTGGTFALSFKGAIADGLAWNISASALQTALRALSTIGGTNVTCTGGTLPGTPITCTFSGALVNQTVPLLVASITGLTGGTPAITVANASGTPQDVIPLSAGIPFSWDVSCGYPYPFQGAVTEIYVTSTNSGRLQIGGGTY